MTSTITVKGSTHRNFHFPADPVTALAYYSNIPRLVRFLPHISLIQQYDGHQARMLYKTRELNLYTVRIYCDLEQIVYTDEHLLRMKPLTITQPITAKSGYRSTTGHGRFISESRFYADGDQTQINYRLELHALLPPPRGLSLVPGNILDQIAYSITKGRIREIADGFIKQSIADFPQWQAENDS